MQSGLLTDSFTRERVGAMGERDWRRRHPNFAEPNLSANLALRDALAPIAARHRTTVPAVAIAWTLAWPDVTGAIVGARSADQMGGWVGGASVRLVPDDLAEIAAAIEATGGAARRGLTRRQRRAPEAARRLPPGPLAGRAARGPRPSPGAPAAARRRLSRAGLAAGGFVRGRRPGPAVRGVARAGGRRS